MSQEELIQKLADMLKQQQTMLEVQRQEGNKREEKMQGLLEAALSNKTPVPKLMKVLKSYKKL